MRKQRGFTMLELIISVLVFGVLAAAAGSYTSSIFSGMRSAYVRDQALVNQKVGSALLEWAQENNLGRLPAPYTGAPYTNAVLDPADTSAGAVALRQEFIGRNLSVADIYGDRTGSQRVRVYQTVAGLTAAIPSFVSSGPLVTLTFDYGVVYMTECALADAACNPTAASGVPGDSVAVTAANYQGWDVAGGDLEPYRLSGLPLQKNMLARSMQRINRLRDKLIEFSIAIQLASTPGLDANFYPAPTAGSAANVDPTGNQGCHEGWYNLATTDILLQLGLNANEYSLTEWGGRVEYCRDYDPIAADSSTYDMAPHNAAIRINNSVSLGLAPSAAPANNAVFSL